MSETLHHNAVDLTGLRFGRLLVLTYAGKATSAGTLWNCQCDCGKTTQKRSGRLRNGSTRSCGCLRNEQMSVMASSKKGEAHWRWKGGRHVGKDGYAKILDPTPEQPYRYRYEHIIVMERHLGRALRDGENVHHKNGQRADNALDNLELWIVQQPAGQRVEDVVAWCTEVLALYAPERLTVSPAVSFLPQATL